MQKNIVIPGWMVGRNSIGITKPYLDFAYNCGRVLSGDMEHQANIIILMPTNTSEEFVEYLLENTDLLILPGGADVDPDRYAKKRHPMTGNQNAFFEYFDTEFLGKFIDKLIPTFGICRGFQSLNVHLGGSLLQHITSDHPTNDPENRRERVHNVYFNSPFDEMLNKGNALHTVNSIHHQAVTPNRMSNSLDITSTTEEGLIDETTGNYYSIVESFMGKELPVAGVQWHPEEIGDYTAYMMVKTIYNRSLQLRSETKKEVKDVAK